MSVYQCPECGEQGKKYNSVLPSDIEEWFCPSCRSHWDIGLKIDNDEHAQVGALLARCRHYQAVWMSGSWHVTIRLLGRCEYVFREGPTQLAAIRAAVEAAEKGVRE